MQVAERVIEFMGTEKPDAVVVDGDGVGAGVVGQINFRGFGAKLFEFRAGGEQPAIALHISTTAVAVWGKMRDWLKSGAEIPDEPELADDLTAVEYGFECR